ncbi:MAG: DUF3883 domain-containing protein [Thermodesulfobacteriota bacterium]|nr:MAG: DUF3883 domain-containing protein [Thermodesulfobacteriota bacterium]
MQTKELLKLIEETGHVGELNRLLSVYKHRRAKRLGKLELIELANQSAGATYRYPNPEPALKVALLIGLLNKDKKIVFLTQTGALFLKLSDYKMDLTFGQSSFLLSLFLDDEYMNSNISQLFSYFGKGADEKLEAKSNPSTWEETMQVAARILQQLGVLEECDGKLCLNVAFESVLPPQILRMVALDEKTLWERLDAQRLRAKKAEELVLIEEQKRLIKIGRPDLAKLVFRIGAEAVSAGFDISSFEHDGSQRLIEVKSSLGKALRFEWSIREREMAFHHKNKYWIYFVPLADILEKRTLPILMIQNPVKLINFGRLSELASSFVVYADGRALLFFNTSTKIGQRDLLQKWS